MKNKLITSYPDYTIYENSEIFSKKHNKFLTPILSNGYLYVKLYGITTKVHPLNRLVLTHFNQDAIKTKYILHLDGNKLNNHVLNLKYCAFKDLINTEKVRAKGKKRIPTILPKDKIEAYKYYIQSVPPNELSAHIRVLGHRVEYLIITERWACKRRLSDYETAFKMYCNGKSSILVRLEFGWSARTYNKAFNIVRQQLINDIMLDVANGKLAYNYIPTFKLKKEKRKSAKSSLKEWIKFKSQFS